MKKNNHKGEKKLLEQIKKNKKNFDKIYKKYYKVVFNYIRTRTNSVSVSEDLASEVFLKVYNAIDDFKWQGVSISSWIFRITRNLLTDYYRKVGRRGTIVSLTEIEDLFEDAGAKDFKEFITDQEEVELYNAIREFKEEDQYLIFYKFFEDLRNRDIAKLTGLAESNVGTRLYRIRKKLKHILNKKFN